MEAKDYLSKHQVPQLFECLLTGLMFNKPQEPIQYLRACLAQIEEHSLAQVKWDFFLEAKGKKGKLPPIKADSILSRESSRILSGGADGSLRASPLPPIISQPSTESSRLQTSPGCAFVLLLGGPGTAKGLFGPNLARCWPGFVHLSMSAAFRRHIARKGTAEARWKMAEALMSRGELAPEELELIFSRFDKEGLTADLVTEQINQHKNAKGFIIEGYPRTMAQLEEWNQLVPSTTQALLIDAEQMTMMATLLRRGGEAGGLQNNPAAISRRLAFFKSHTLPVCKSLDDQGLLHAIDGEQTQEDIFGALVTALSNKLGPPLSGSENLNIPRPPSAPKPSRPHQDPPAMPALNFRPVVDIRDLSLSVPDSGRAVDLPQCPIVLLFGGPGSGQTHQATALCARYPAFHHVSAQDIAKARVLEGGVADRTWGMMSALVQQGEVGPEEIDGAVIAEELRKLPHDAGCILLEGFPRSEKQLEEFNRHIGRADLAVLLDCDELYMTLRLLERGQQTGRLDDNLAAISRRIAFYKEETLPVVRHMDQAGKLAVFLGDRDASEVFFDLCRLIDFTFFPRAQPEEAEELEEAAEEEIVPTKATLLYDDSGSKKSQDGLKQCKVVFVTGGPGSGKGTQCEKILSDFDVGHVSTGDLIRAEVESGSERATQLKETMEKGELVSLDIVLELLREHLSKNSTKHKGFLVDGFPREMDQATRFEKEVVECLCMVYMDASEEVMKERILERAKTSGRSDDNEETIVKRIATFRENNDAIVKHFEEKGKLVKIDCNGSDIDAIYSSVKEALEKAGLPLQASEEAPAEAPATEEAAAEEEKKEEEKEEKEPAKENGEAASPAEEAPQETKEEEAPAQAAE